MKKFIMGAAFFAASFLQIRSVQAQAVPAPTQSMYIEVDGVRSNRYGALETDGSPFFNDNWINGIATSDKGENYQLNLKYDVLRDQPIFADKDGGTMLFTETITRFTLGEDVFQNGFPAADQWKKTAFYKTLGTGKNKVLKHYYKKRIEVRDVGGITGYKLEDNMDCFLFKDGKMISIKPNKGAIFNALSDKKAQVENYTKVNKLDFKKDADVGKLMDYYSSL
jgi:hypothetical protein